MMEKAHKYVYYKMKYLPMSELVLRVGLDSTLVNSKIWSKLGLESIPKEEIKISVKLKVITISLMNSQQAPYLGLADQYIYYKNEHLFIQANKAMAKFKDTEMFWQLHIFGQAQEQDIEGAILKMLAFYGHSRQVYFLSGMGVGDCLMLNKHSSRFLAFHNDSVFVNEETSYLNKDHFFGIEKRDQLTAQKYIGAEEILAHIFLNRICFCDILPQERLYFTRLIRSRFSYSYKEASHASSLENSAL